MIPGISTVGANRVYGTTTPIANMHPNDFYTIPRTGLVVMLLSHNNRLQKGDEIHSKYIHEYSVLPVYMAQQVSRGPAQA